VQRHLQPSRLLGLGLDPLAESAYQALLERPAWTLQELALRLAVEPAITAEAVARLTALELVTACDDGLRLRPIRPQVGLTALIARREAELAGSWRELEQGRQAAAELATEAEELCRDHRGGPADMWWGEQARSGIRDLLSSASDEVISMSCTAAGQLDRCATPGWPGIAEGVGYRVVLTACAPDDPRYAGHLCRLARDGAQVRTVGRVPLSMLSVDRTVAVLPLGISATGRAAGVSVLRLPGAVAAMVELFGRVWAEATPLGDPADPEHAGPGPRERTLLALLVAGSTDESAAFRMGVSVRTVRRMVSGLMERLGARSRFEAGALAAEHGWLQAPSARR